MSLQKCSSFLDFIRDPNIIKLAMAAVLSDCIGKLANSTFEHLIHPLFKIDMNKDGKGDGKQLLNKIEERKLKILGVEFGLGEFVVSLLRFLIVAYILYALSRILTKNN